ncbi:co-chaperone DjlA [Marinobacter nanhaiticus D15-8W]|uniref:Co-chaperone protein DjlA n=1 Tax=Marinobacter nanhaiticus D15-8W TaxID=626887 RepID=N6WY90_9GAMM|nr:co-chaperone DjlA [Marinobacter nanhaiticus]ENO16576.1 co-chaperone DjlA [Marinobacter nanhaiticus D15-8W]BES72373.1 co-chaperone DjlA [Marinobacter nanhaiticus D15-8W]
MFLAIIFGGLIGYSFGRFPGLLIGAVAGYFLAKALTRKLRQGLFQVQSQFLESTFSVMGALCKADGVVTRDEIQVAETLFSRLRLSDAQRETAKAAFQRGKAADFDLEGELEQLLRVTRGQRALLQMFLQVQVSAVAADGEVHPAEHQMLLRIARKLGIPEAQVEQLEAMLRGARGGAASGGPSTGQQLADAYKVLGVSESASDAEIKKAYRKLMSQNHPDKLAGRGLPESMREMAEEKTREISHAYDVIKAARGTG